MFRVTEQRDANRVVLKLEGRLAAAWVDELDACWRAAAEETNEAIFVDLCDVDVVDAAGEQLLARMHHAGVRFLTRGCVMRELVREISEVH
jgi:anti-anti-sigma regulatory factor